MTSSERSRPDPVVLEARDVPLGGIRSMSVRRSLPQRDLPTIGAWCFLDRFGPQSTRMRVEPHPHMGLQTVTWPLTGEVRHRDSIGNDVTLRPGQLNLMTSGRGIAHSEYSLGDGEVELDALQLWIALPDATRNSDRAFERHEFLPHAEVRATAGIAGHATVVMGTFAGVTSPATTHTPLVAAQVGVPSGSSLDLPLNREWEHGLMILDGDAAFEPGAASPQPTPGDLLYLAPGHDSIAVSSQWGARIFIIGGEPLAEDLVMWWNFVGRSHDEIALAWEEWQGGSPRFGEVPGHGDVRIPAPPLPTVRLLPRRRAR